MHIKSSKSSISLLKTIFLKRDSIVVPSGLDDFTSTCEVEYPSPKHPTPECSALDSPSLDPVAYDHGLKDCIQKSYVDIVIAQIESEMEE